MPHSFSATAFTLTQLVLTAACFMDSDTTEGMPYRFQPQLVKLFDQEIWRLCADHCSPASAQDHTPVNCGIVAYLHTLAWGRQGVACGHVNRGPAVLWAPHH